MAARALERVLATQGEVELEVEPNLFRRCLEHSRIRDREVVFPAEDVDVRSFVQVPADDVAPSAPDFFFPSSSSASARLCAWMIADAAFGVARAVPSSHPGRAPFASTAKKMIASTSW